MARFRITYNGHPLPPNTEGAEWDSAYDAYARMDKMRIGADGHRRGTWSYEPGIPAPGGLIYDTLRFDNRMVYRIIENLTGGAGTGTPDSSVSDDTH